MPINCLTPSLSHDVTQLGLNESHNGTNKIYPVSDSIAQHGDIVSNFQGQGHHI